MQWEQRSLSLRSIVQPGVEIKGRRGEDEGGEEKGGRRGEGMREEGRR